MKRRLGGRVKVNLCRLGIYSFMIVRFGPFGIFSVPAIHKDIDKPTSYDAGDRVRFRLIRLRGLVRAVDLKHTA